MGKPNSRPSRRPAWALTFGLALAGIIPGRGFAQTEPSPPAPTRELQPAPEKPSPAPVKIHPGAIEYGREVFLPHMGQATKNSFAAKESLIGLAAGGALAGAIAAQDQKIEEYWETEKPIGAWSEIGDQWGAGAIQPAIVLGMFGWAQRTKNQKLATNAEVFAEALILDGLVINLMKPIVGRERPDQSDRLSFPSGHTGNAFTFAALMDARYGHKWGIPMFALAAFTGLTRMQDHAHWASDVTFGATLGTVIGYAVSKHHDDYPYQKTWHRKTKITLLPIAPANEDDRTGLFITMPIR